MSYYAIIELALKLFFVVLLIRYQFDTIATMQYKMIHRSLKLVLC